MIRNLKMLPSRIILCHLYDLKNDSGKTPLVIIDDEIKDVEVELKLTLRLLNR